LSDGPISVGDIAAIKDEFRTHHEDVYGYTLADSAIEIQSVRLSAVGASEPPTFRKIERGGADAEQAIKSRRPVWFGEQQGETDIFEGAKLRAGNEIPGPAIIEEPTTTTLIAPGWRLRVDDLGSYLLWPDGRELDGIRERLANTGHQRAQEE
jgi:N-methylhydantoinase A